MPTTSKELIASRQIQADHAAQRWINNCVGTSLDLWLCFFSYQGDLGVPHSKQQTAGVCVQVQSADSEDPWFQLEWGEIMALENRVKEASLHLQVAAALFITHLDQVR